MKTIIRTVTENKQLSKKTPTQKIHQTKRHKQNQTREPKCLLLWSGLYC